MLFEAAAMAQPQRAVLARERRCRFGLGFGFSSSSSSATGSSSSSSAAGLRLLALVGLVLFVLAALRLLVLALVVHDVAVLDATAPLARALVLELHERLEAHEVGLQRAARDAHAGRRLLEQPLGLEVH